MSKFLLKVLGDYNQQLSAALARAEQQWPALCTDQDVEPTEQEEEQQRRALLLAMTYLDQLQQLLGRQAATPAAVPAYRERGRAG